jgi:hypothetical protein
VKPELKEVSPRKVLAEVAAATTTRRLLTFAVEDLEQLATP